MEQMKSQGPPSEPRLKKILYEGEMVQAEIYQVREQGGIQEYSLIRSPHCREFTAISLVKTNLLPVNDKNIAPDIKKWFR